MAVTHKIPVLDPQSLREIEQALQWQRRTGSRLQPPAVRKVYEEGPDRESVPVYNASASAAPQFGIMELGALLSNNVVHSSGMPAYSSISRYGIVCAPIASGGYGRVWIEGMHPALIILKNGESIAIRDQVRPHKDSFYGRLFELGPMIVESVIGDSTNATGADLLTSALVRMTEERGDHKLADTQGVCDGAYQAFVFSSDYVVAAGDVGKPTVDSA